MDLRRARGYGRESGVAGDGGAFSGILGRSRGGGYPQDRPSPPL